jgi:hypothetical protein
MASKLVCAELITLVAVLIIGCSNNDGLPKGWTKTVPGKFEGVSSSYKEVMEFRADGTFTHQGFNGSNQLFAESGHWTASSNRLEIAINPDTDFTELYDPRTHTFSSAGEKFISYVYWPAWHIPVGTPFSSISASADYEFSLNRQPQ